MFKTNIFKAGAAALAVAGLASLGVSSAQADPPAAPPYKTYNAVGSDTIQDVWNDLAANAVSAADIGSWDANATPGNITTRSGGASFLRPVGSGNGVKALSAAWDTANHNWLSWNGSANVTQAITSADISFARSSSGAAGGGSALTYIPFARDAVSVAYTPGVGESSVTFSRAELKAIFGGSDENSTGTITYDVSTGLPIKGGNILHPFLPQSASGTRSFFLGASGANVTSVPGYVDQSASYLENRGGVISGTTRALIPFSAGQWVYQQHAGGATDTTGGLLIASVDQDNNAGTAARTAVTGSGSGAAPGTLYGSLSAPPTGADPFARDTYNVVPTSQFDDDPDLIDYLLQAAGVSNTDAADTIEEYGFGVLDYADDPTTYPYPTSAFVH
jgi:ABC-type phosphate transport system substrate-binding protein